MPYYKGIRIFNLLVELDFLQGECNDESAEYKRTIIRKCEEQQQIIQRLLCKWSTSDDLRIAYPHAKIKTIVIILSECLGIVFDEKKVDDEILNINEYWNSVANTPFRDATPKNMLLFNPELHLSKFESEDDRRNFIKNCIADGSFKHMIEHPIIDFDFCSCIHNTTPEDDVISLKYHERTWSGITPSQSDLVWNGYKPNGQRAAISFLIRYFRFGGRKAAYRLIFPSGHCIRFKHDNDVFYFDKLPSIMLNLWSDCYRIYPNLMSFIETAAQQLRIARSTIDLFRAARLGSNAKCYTDVYPY